MTHEELVRRVAFNQYAITILVALAIVSVAIQIFLMVLSIRVQKESAHQLRINREYAEMSEGKKKESRAALLTEVKGAVKEAAGESHSGGEIRVISPTVIVDPASGSYRVPEEKGR